MAGAIVQWLRDGLGIIQKSSDVEKLACTVEAYRWRGVWFRHLLD